MRKLIKYFFWAGAFLLTLPVAWGFVPGGPIGNGGDGYQTPALDYGIRGEQLGPKNIGEEYRRVTPVMYYACDSSFLNYFGLVGSTNIDAAFGLMNIVLTNGVSSFSSDLSEFPLESQQFNYTAQALGLTDLKSGTFQLLVEQMGLANPDFYVWTLHDRIAGPNCPADISYNVIQRNLDFMPTPFNQVQYSPYINGTLFTYQIFETCAGLAGTRNSSVDPFGAVNTAVASQNLQSGGFFTGLTRDDVGCFRYLLSSNNINWENPAPSGGLLLVTNVLAPQTLTTLPISLILSQSGSTNDPASLATNFPGVVILSVVTNTGLYISTNVVYYFTNQSVLPVFSNTVAGGLPVVHNLTNIYYFTNQPGPTVINYDNSGFWTEIDTMDLATFVDSVAIDDPATLQAAYPGLSILSASPYPGYADITNYVSYLTNQVGSPYGSPPILVTVPVITNGFTTNWTYVFGNVFTNHVYPKRWVTIQTTWVTNLVGAPYPNIYSNTTSISYFTNKVAGDFFLIPTNWCGFDLILSKSSSSMVGAVTAQPFGSFTNSTATNSTIFSVTKNYFDTYTNYSYLVYPGICEPVVAVATNYATNILTTYVYYFGGIVTNRFYTNTYSVVITTNVSACFGGSPDLLCTNISIVTTYLNQPSGDFLPIPANWCGYTILSALQTNTIYATNIVSATNGVSSGTNGGQFSYTQTTITAYTNVVFLVQPDLCSQAAPVPALRQGIEHLQFVRANYDSLLGQFFQPLTNRYSMVTVTNSQRVVEFYQRVVTGPDFLLRAADLGATRVTRGINFDQSTVSGGLAGPGTIIPSTTFTYTKVGPIFANGPAGNRAFLDQNTQQTNSLVTWASFDGSTNLPVLYPNGASIADLVSQMFIQVAPATVPDGTNGVPYSAAFTVTGGQSPYVWGAPGFSNLVPGLTFTPGTATVSGTPVGPGVFNFTLQVTDAANRVVNLSYSITIH